MNLESTVFQEGLPFSVARLPRIEFGPRTIDKVPALARRYGSRALVITGAASFTKTARWDAFLHALRDQGITWSHVTVSEEPSPQLVDETVEKHRQPMPDVVIGIGGGSVLDGAKAVAGLLIPGNSVMDHLEGIGPEKPYKGPATPFIAVPTTAGTGSEATKNAVLSVSGKEGFKKSFRDEQLVPDFAVVDPDLLVSCPPELIAANGMDALTQLMESYVSSRANPFTEALAWSGLQAVHDALIPWFQGEGNNAVRAKMAYGALLSGITLAQTGLGSVHGLASPLGAFFPIPHGVVCGTLVAEATRINIAAMQDREPHAPALKKYARLGGLLGDSPDPGGEQALVDQLTRWTEDLGLPRLGRYGITRDDFPRVVANCRGSSMKTNPIVLNDDEVSRILEARL